MWEEPHTCRKVGGAKWRWGRWEDLRTWTRSRRSQKTCRCHTGLEPTTSVGTRHMSINIWQATTSQPSQSVLRELQGEESEIQWTQRFHVGVGPLVQGIIKHHLSCSISHNGKKKKVSLMVSVPLYSAVPDTDQAAIFTHPVWSQEGPQPARELLAQMEAISYTCFQRLRRIRDSQRRSGASSGASPLPGINKQEVYDCLCVTKAHTHIHTHTHPEKKMKHLASAFQALKHRNLLFVPATKTPTLCLPPAGRQTARRLFQWHTQSLQLCLF